MLPTLLFVLLAQSSEPVKVAVPGLSFAGIDATLGEVYLERFSTILGRSPHLKVTTRRDIAQVLGLERQKALVGCSDAVTSCLAELAGGLGVDAILSGSLAKTGSSYTVTLRVVRARDGAVVATASERLRDEDALGEWLDAEAPRLAEQIRLTFDRRVPVLSAPVVERRPSGAVRWIPAIIGGVALGTGAVLFGLSKSDASLLRGGTLTDPEIIDRTAASGQLKEVAGGALMATGAALAAASVLWVALGGASDVQVSAAPTAQGLGVGVAGSFP